MCCGTARTSTPDHPSLAVETRRVGFMSTIHAQLAPLVTAAGVTATADRAGVHRVTLSRWVHGHADLTGAKLEAVAKAVGCTIEVLPKTGETIIRR
jgi:transcriptional regulator with XRE-family HTH domain